MRFPQPLLQLPIRFDAERLAAEVNALPRSAWRRHPYGFPGNEAVPLISPGGLLNDAFDGAMGPTEHLERCGYIMDLMAELDCVWGRSRLMALGPGAEVPRHIDIHYYWRTHRRLHIPVITNPGVIFTCDGKSVHMKAGECWAFDSFALHYVENKSNHRRVHLVLDTVGGGRLWDLVEEALGGAGVPDDVWSKPDGEPRKPLKFEQLNRPAVMSPWEMRHHLDYVLDHAPPETHGGIVGRRLDRFVTNWQAAWSRFGTSDDGLPTYGALIEGMRNELRSLNADQVVLRNNQPLGSVVDALILNNAVAQGSAAIRAAE